MHVVSTTARDIFLAALDQANPSERAAFINRECAGDIALQQHVEALLRHHEQPDSLLDQPRISLKAADGKPDDSPATMDQTRTEPIGSLIGSYKLLEQIGEGGMGLVYMAEQQQPVRRLVALKLIKPGMDSKQVIARFEAEKQALAMMDHPNIAKVHDAGTTDTGRPYFAMELVRGIPINEFCDQARLAARERLELMVEVCQAVQHAHQKGIIHRDLKPSNVLVTMNDATPLPKVIDFGIAKALGSSLIDHTLHTGFAQLVGTPLYMSPEQASLNHLGVDTRSDVYSLGVLLYELLTGTTPFDKETLTKAGLDEMRRIIREDEPPRPSTRVSTLDAQALSTVSTRRSTDPRRISIILRGELDWIVMKALEKDRSRRYESASALAADIHRYLSGELVQAYPPSATYRFRKFAKKHKAAFTTAALLAASLLLGTVISLWQAIRATAAEVQASANEAKAKSEEQKATALAQSEATQRKQAEKNFEAALEAMDRLLANINDRELSDVARLGPLQLKMLKDAIAFYERLPVQSESSVQIRFRLALTWKQVAWSCRDLGDVELAAKAFSNAIEILSRILAEHHSNPDYRATLADFHYSAGSFFLDQNPVFFQAEKHFRRSSELYAELVSIGHEKDTTLIREAVALRGLSGALRRLGKQDEAIGHQKRAADLLELSRNTTDLDRAYLFYGMAITKSGDASAESDDLFRRAIAEFHKYAAFSKLSEYDRDQWAGKLRVIGGVFSSRFPEEAETLFEESISLWRQAVLPLTRQRDHQFFLNWSLLSQARHLRRIASHTESRIDTKATADRIARAESLFQEAIAAQRKLILQYGLVQDRFDLIKILQEQSEHLLDNTSDAKLEQRENVVVQKLQADALLTEAIQLCRTLAAEFPDKADYKNRLAALLKLQSQHFGPKDTPNP